MKSKLNKREQEIVACTLVQEFGYIGVNLAGARKAVADGDWDDHWAARKLLQDRSREVFLAVHMRDCKADLIK